MKKNIFLVVAVVSFFGFTEIIRAATPPDFEVNWSLAWALLGVAIVAGLLRFGRDGAHDDEEYGGHYQPRDLLDRILDKAGVNPLERLGFWNSDGTRFEYSLHDGRNISIPMEWSGTEYVPDEAKIESEGWGWVLE